MVIKTQESSNKASIRNVLFALGVAVLTLMMVKTNGISSTTYRAILASSGLIVVSILMYFNVARRLINTKLFVAFLCYCIFVFFFSFLQHGLSTTIGALLSQITFFVGILITFVVAEISENKGAIKLLFYMTLIVWLYENIQLIILCLSNPNIGRMISAHSADYTIVSSIGSPYGIAEGSSLIAIILFKFAIDKDYYIKPLFRLALLIVVLIFATAVYQTQSTITSIIMMLFLGIALIMNITRGNYSRRVKRVLLLCLAIALSVFLFRERIGYFLISKFSNYGSVFNIRMYEIGRFAAGYSSSNDMQARVDLFTQSWQSIWKHPIFGNLYNGGSISGEHCHVLDVVSDYGLLGSIPYLLIFVYFQKILKQRLENYDFFIWLPVVIMSFSNPLRIYQTFFSIFYICPLCYFVFNSFKKESLIDSYPDT